MKASLVNLSHIQHNPTRTSAAEVRVNVCSSIDSYIKCNQRVLYHSNIINLIQYALSTVEKVPFCLFLLVTVFKERFFKTFPIRK